MVYKEMGRGRIVAKRKANRKTRVRENWRRRKGERKRVGFEMKSEKDGGGHTETE